MSVTNHSQELVALTRLKGADYNPRQMPDVEMGNLMRSLREFGFVEPVVARREDGLIIGGHQRIAAFRRILAEAGQAEAGVTIPVVMLAGVSDERAKLLNLALNKIHGEWDYNKLSDVLASLGGVGEDLGLSGFSLKEVDDILGLMGHSEMPDLSPEAAQAAEKEVADDLAARARRFQFEVATDKDAEFCRKTLKRFGMDGPATGSGAFVRALRAALVKRKRPSKEAPEVGNDHHEAP